MEQSYIPFLCGAAILFSTVPLSILFYWASKRGWFTLRLIACSVFLVLSSTGVLLWVYEKNKEMSLIFVGLGVLAGLIVLSLRITSPRLVRLLNLKW